MFSIKICGITNAADALLAANAGADAIGLNFYPESPRCVDVAQAKEIAAFLPRTVVRVGVFVNAPTDEVIRIYEQVGLAVIQLHGDEPPEMREALGKRPVVRALRCPEGDLGASARRHFQEWGRRAQAVLVDAYQPYKYGGTGRVVDWTLLRQWRDWLPGTPLILAGGLGPGNVAEAILTARPAAVDTASGVEIRPGRKDPELVGGFVSRAKAAFAELDASDFSRSLYKT